MKTVMNGKKRMLSMEEKKGSLMSQSRYDDCHTSLC